MVKNDGDGMIKIILLIITCVSVGVGFYLFLNPSAMMVAQNTLSPIFTPIATQIGNIANAIPKPIRDILQIISIPSIISGVFLAWTKVRAMKYAKQVEQQATQQVTSLSGQVEGVKDAAGAYSGSLTSEITSLAQKLESTKTELAQNQEQIKQLTGDLTQSSDARHRLEEDNRHLANKIKELQYQLDVATGKIKLPIA